MSSSQPKKLSVSVFSAGCSSAQPLNSDNLACRLRVLNWLLLQWHSEGNHSSYIQQVNGAIVDNIITLDVHCNRLERRIARRAGTLKSNAAKLRGGARAKQLDEYSTFDVLKGETVSASQLMSDLDDTVKDVENWMTRCRKAEAAALRLTESLQDHVRRQLPTNSNSQPVPSHDELVNLGQDMSSLSARQQRRKLSQVKTSVEKALWFIESFGLDLHSISFKTRTTNKVMDMTFVSPESGTDSEVNDSCVRQTLYLLERFGVSDEFYHELSMVNPALPRSHQVKHSRHLITKAVDIQRLPEPYNGAYRSFRECLSAALAHEVCVHS